MSNNFGTENMSSDKYYHFIIKNGSMSQDYVIRKYAYNNRTSKYIGINTGFFFLSYPLTTPPPAPFLFFALGMYSPVDLLSCPSFLDPAPRDIAPASFCWHHLHSGAGSLLGYSPFKVPIIHLDYRTDNKSLPH